MTTMLDRDLADLASATPTAIDMTLAELHRQLGGVVSQISNTCDSVHFQIRDATIRYIKSTGVRFWRLDHDDAEAKLAEQLDRWASDDWRWYDVKHGRETLAELADLRQKSHALRALIDICEAEFDRRGGWTRAFKVVNANGHIHSSRACSTCLPTTRFIWLPELSGKDESEIIAYAGVWACSVCYPDAPVAHHS